MCAVGAGLCACPEYDVCPEYGTKQDLSRIQGEHMHIRGEHIGLPLRGIPQIIQWFKQRYYILQLPDILKLFFYGL